VESDGDGQKVIFKQIAGLLARRIVFYPKVGDRLDRGQRVGLIKFGSRVDVLVGESARVNVKIGDHVKGGASVLAYLQPQVERPLAAAGSAPASERAQ
jgi:phosphatidylserine decarboxylase